MVYKRYFKRGRKRYGPYYYTTIRTPDGKVKSIYVGQSLPKTPKTKHNPVFLLHTFLILLIVALVGLTVANNPTITGFITGITEDYTQPLDLELAEDQSYNWSVPEHPNVFYLKSISLSGSIIGDGSVKAYLDDGTNQYLILDSDNLVEEVSPISGFVAAISGKSITLSDSGSDSGGGDSGGDGGSGDSGGDSGGDSSSDSSSSDSSDSSSDSDDSSDSDKKQKKDDKKDDKKDKDKGKKEKKDKGEAESETESTEETTESQSEAEPTTEEQPTEESVEEPVADEPTVEEVGTSTTIEEPVIEEEPSIEEISAPLIEEKPVIETVEEAQPETNVSAEPTESEPTNETVEENITIEENITLQNITELNLTAKNITEENITVQRIDFSEACAESCILPEDTLNQTSYSIIFEIEQGTILELTSIEYSLEDLTQEIEIQAVVVDKDGNVIDSDAELYDEQDELVEEISTTTQPTQAQGLFRATTSGPQPTTSKVAQGTYDVKANIPNHVVKDISFENVKLDEDVQAIVKLDDTPETEGFVEMYAIDPTLVNFTSATVTVTAKGSQLYKCKDWNFSEQSCYGEWILFKSDLVPGQDYTFMLTPEDPGFGEVINITKAEHLDENRSFISNVYEEVRALDDVWSETIPTNHYIRATFEKNLTSENDITLYPRTVNGTPRVEIYEENESEIVAEFTSLNDNEYNKVYLTNLIGIQDTFDLRILNGSITIDHIIDPNNAPIASNVVLSSTSGNNLTTDNLTVTYDISDAENDTVKNITNWYKDDTSITVLNMPFEGGSNSTYTKDYSGYDNDGTVNGSTWNANGGYDGKGAYEFDGINFDKIQIPDSSLWDIKTTDNITIEAWIRLASAIPSSYANIWGDWNGPCFQIKRSSGIDYLIWYAGGSISQSNAVTLTPGTWYHIVMVKTAQTNITFYQNSINVGSVTPSDANVTPNSITIGSDEGGEHINGTIDEVRIYNRSLSEEEITALYQNKTDLIVSQETSIGDVWKACVTPNDGASDGTEVCSNNLTVVSDATPPAITLISPSNDSGDIDGTMLFEYNVTDGDTAVSSCELIIDDSTDQTDNSITEGTTLNFTKTGMSSGTYSWKVNCTSEGGEGSSGTRTFTIKQAIFEDNFTSAGGFQNDSDNKAPWERGNATQMSGCYSPPSCWGTNLTDNYFYTGPYDDFLTQATSMNFSSYTNVTLTLYHYRYFEDASTLWDAGVVDINYNGSWTRLTPDGGYNGTVQGNAGSTLGNQSAYGYHGSGWELATFNLTPYAGNSDVKIRFHFAADQAANDRGWFIDDVRITGDSVNDATPPSSVTGLANQSAGTTWIYWNWTNPSDADFNSSIVYLDGVWQANTTNNYYNATGLNAGTSYTLTVHTKDDTGNVNDTDVNSTASTSGSPIVATLEHNWVEADVYIDEHSLDPDDNEIQIKWDVSFISNGSTVNDADLCLYITNVTGSPDNDANISRVDNQTWTESISASSYQNLSQTNSSTSSTWSSTTTDTRSCIDVTNLVAEDIGNSYTSFRIEDVDYPITSTYAVHNTTTLDVGGGGVLDMNHLVFASSEHGIESYRPRLVVNYTGEEDTTAPGSVVGLANQSQGLDWIYWNWTNPTDSDFSQAIVYLDGSNVANTSNNYYNATGLSSGTNYTLTVHTKDIYGNINSNDVNSTATTLYSDTSAPTWSNNKTSPVSPATYSSGQSYQFNITWNDTTAIDTVLFEHNFTGTLTNYSATGNVSNDYYYNYNDLAAGSYVWRNYANDTNGYTNSTDQWNYVVNKVTSTCSLSFDKASPQTYGTAINASCGCTNAEASAVLYRNGSDVTATENNQLVTLPAGSYSYVCNVSATQNYTAANNSSDFIINKANSVVNLSLNGAENNLTITYPQTVTAVYSTNVLTATMYRNGSDVSSENNTAVTLAAGTYNYTVVNDGNENYSSSSKTFFVTVNQNTTSLTLTASPSWTETYPTSTTINCTADNSEATPQLYLDGTPVANPYTTTHAAGTYNYTCNNSATQNYTADSASSILTINQASTSTQLYIDEAQANKTVTYPTQTNATALTSAGSVTLYRNGVAVSNPEIATLATGTYNYTAINSGNENYTASSETWWMTVNQNTSTCSLTFNPASPQTYNTSINASCSCTNPEANASLYRNGVDVTTSENSLYTVLAAQMHNYTCNVTSTQNYTTAQDTGNFTINKAASEVTLTLNSADSNVTIDEGQTINITATLITGTGSIEIYQDGSSINSGASPLTNTTTYNTIGTYNITATYNETQNYTSSSETHFIIVQSTPSAPSGGGGGGGGGTAAITTTTENITTQPTVPSPATAPTPTEAQETVEEEIEEVGPAGTELAGRAVFVAPINIPNPEFAVPAILLFVILIALISLRHMRLSKKFKKVLTGLHAALIGIIIILLIATFEPSITGNFGLDFGADSLTIFAVAMAAFAIFISLVTFFRYHKPPKAIKRRKVGKRTRRK